MVIAMFIMEPGQRDDEFQRLNALIYAAAEATGGFLGEEMWRAVDGTRMNAIYYWESMGALEEFAKHPNHLEAKRQYERWYDGYQVVVAEVQNAYGDGALVHLTKT